MNIIRLTQENNCKINKKIEKMLPKTETFNIQLLNNFCKNKKGVYELLSGSLGFFLPKFESRAVSEKFLLQALQKEITLLERNNIRPSPSLKEKVSCTDLFEEVTKLTPGLNLGYNIPNLPDKHYLCDVLFSLKPDHPYFVINSEFATTRELDER